jgi:hypothetical protein
LDWNYLCVLFLGLWNGRLLKKGPAYRRQMRYSGPLTISLACQELLSLLVATASGRLTLSAA